jgi:hypothetical protein
LPSAAFHAIVARIPKRPFSRRLYFDSALFESARIIGYDGIGIAEFWENKQLHLPVNDFSNAVYYLTKADKRAEEPARYELNGDARRFCFGLLGPLPEHAMRGSILHWPNNLLGEEVRRRPEGYRRTKAGNEAEATAKDQGKSPKQRRKEFCKSHQMRRCLVPKTAKMAISRPFPLPPLPPNSHQTPTKLPPNIRPAVPIHGHS